MAMVTGLLVATGAPAWADSVRDAQWSLGYLHVAEAQKISQGEGVTVAVLDTGVNPNQPDIAGSVLSGLDAVTPARDGRTDADGHGTAMAALIAGHGHGVGGSDGILGVAPKAKILPVTVWPPGTLSLRPRDLSTGIEWAVEHGAQVICIAGTGMSNSILEEAINGAVSRGVVIVAGAGNTSKDPGVGYPAAYPESIAVSGIDEQGQFASSVSVSGAAVDIAAPAVNVQIPNIGGGYRSAQGTSMSTAIVTGVVALIKAKYPNLDAKQIFERLKATAIDKGTNGLDEKYGWGIVDPVGALTKDVPGANGSPSASAKPGDSATSGSDLAGGGSGSRKLLVGAAIVGGFVIAATVLAVSVIGLTRRRRFPTS
jgi:type VII secretion-associated serine protease mycosin